MAGFLFLGEQIVATLDLLVPFGCFARFSQWWRGLEWQFCFSGGQLRGSLSPFIIQWC